MMNITNTTTYSAALIAEAKRSKRSVANLSQAALKRAELNALQTLERIGEAVSNVNARLKSTDPIVNQMPSFESPKMVAKSTSPKVTKRSLAAVAFAQNLGAKRKIVIEAIMAEANLSKAGSATYYQNFKSGKWTLNK